ncbi:TIGR00266 family protein [Candidatus Woesearchaeota archaeon]|nr:TIGR00266 family protein [Candidatus Woesearchaeota archaeon]
MRYRIDGTLFPAVTFELEKGESVYSEAGGMAWMSENIELGTEARGGLVEGIKRRFAGESIFLNTFTCVAGAGTATFTSEFPGKVLALELTGARDIICQKDAFMCATPGVKLEMHFRRKLGAGLFGGEGFVLQRLSGRGAAFVEIAGEVIEYALGDGERLMVDPGHIAMYDSSVDFDIQLVGGLKNALLGGEGLFLASVRGPGRVWLQTMPLENLAGALRRHFGGGRRNPLRALLDIFT